MQKFTHLHLHTEYSLLDSVIRVPKLIERIKEFDMKAVAITDHGSLLGLYPFWNYCKKNNIKSIIGCEVYVARTSRFDRESIEGKASAFHLVLLAQNQEGYHNLVKLVSQAHLEGFYRRPRIDRELLEKYNKGLICLSACLAGEVPLLLLNNNEEKAIKSAEYYRDLFGKDNYFIEIQRNGIDMQETVNPKLISLSQKLNIPLVATCDSHYLERGDGILQEIMWGVSDGKKLHDETRRRSYGEEFYVKNSEEMTSLFKDIPQAIENTQKIVDSIEDVTIKFDRIIPQFWGDLKNKTPREILYEQTYEGAKKKYPEITTELKERIEYELKVIHDKGYDDYFLIVGDLMRWARSKGIVVSVRGSAGGSVVAYCLEIINIEPIGWNCYFERFLNPERPSPPDIDIDLQDDRREEVIKYIQDKYGDGFCAICAIGRMKTKAAIKDIGRVMDIELSLTEKLSKMVHVKFGKVKKIKKMMEDDAEFASIVKSDKRLGELVELVDKVEGIARHVSTHACGHLITPKAITEYIPVQMETGSRNRIITQIEGAQLEELGFMKFDFLGLRNLTIINNVLKLLNQNVPEDQHLLLETIPLDDEKTFKTFSSGKTTGVFQFESSGMKKYLKDLKPTNLEDICFMAAAYRPGPMQFISGYIDCKFKRKEPEYLIPELKPIVGMTYGYAIYQEQVIKITVDIAGYSMGSADLLRRAMGKKKIEIMKKEEPRFKEGVMKKGYNKEVANRLWEYLLPFADYGFNKAHAAGYALVAYWTAYLKTHYPTEFIAGILQSDILDIERLAIDIDEARNLGVEVLPPDINESDEYFKIIENNSSSKKIRFGLLAIKNFGENIAEALIKEREKNGIFNSFEDILTRINHKDLNKKSIEALTMAGAFNQFIEANVILENMESILKHVRNIQKEAESNQVNLFHDVDRDYSQYSLDLIEAAQATPKQKLMWEKEYLGLYLSGHPFREIEKYFEKIAPSYSNLNNFKDQNIKIVGLISSFRKIFTKRNQPMLFVRLENTRENIEVVVFPRIYEDTKELWEEDIPVIVEGRVSKKDDSSSIICNKVEKIIPENIQKLAEDFLKVENDTRQNYRNNHQKQAFLVLDTIPSKEILFQLREVFNLYLGDKKLFLEVNNKKIVTKTSIRFCKELKEKVEKVVGKENALICK